MKNDDYKQNKLLDRMQRRNEVKNQLTNILQSGKVLAIEDIRKIMGFKRSTFNYWINVFEKEKWLHRKFIEHEGASKQGQPKTLILDKKFIEWQETLRRKNWESYEEKQLESDLIQRILRLVDEKQSSEKQYKELVELFKKFNKDNFGARLVFLLYGDMVRVNFKLSLTERGEKELEKIEKKSKKKASS